MWVSQLLKKKLYLMLSAFLMISCGKKEEESARLKSQAKSCVNQFFASQYSYFFNPEQIEETEDNLECVDDRLQETEAYMVSRNQTLTHSELLSWINQKYLTELPLSASHLASWLQFKKWIVGGDETKLTVSEVKKLRYQIRRWKKFILKINSDLKGVVQSSSEKDISYLRNYKDDIETDLDDFLFDFPDLISRFDYQVFVALTLENRAYHNSSLPEISPELIRSLLWFANGQETTILSKKTANFMLMTHHYFYLFKSQIGNQWSDIFTKLDKFTSYSSYLLEDLQVWLGDVRTFEYRAFEYLSEFISYKLFSNKFTGQQVFNFIKMINEKYLTEGKSTYVTGFGLDQNESLKGLLSEVRDFNSSVDADDLQSVEQSWTYRFIRRHRRLEIFFDLNSQGLLHIVNDSESVPSRDLLKLINFISVPVNRVVNFKGQYYSNALTKDEFHELVEEFSLLNSLWENPMSTDRFEEARALGTSVYDRVTSENLFHFITPLLQTEEYKKRIINE